MLQTNDHKFLCLSCFIVFKQVKESFSLYSNVAIIKVNLFLFIMLYCASIMLVLCLYTKVAYYIQNYTSTICKGQTMIPYTTTTILSIGKYVSL